MSPHRRLIVPQAQLQIILERLAAQLVERHGNFEHTVIIGLQPRGSLLAARLHELLESQTGKSITFGKLDATFYRDDFRRGKELLLPNSNHIDFSIEGQEVVLVDDVLFTGRTVRAGLDALLDFGRPAKVELMVLVERLYTQEIPIHPDYVGRKVNTLTNEKVVVGWKEIEGEDNIWIISQ